MSIVPDSSLELIEHLDWEHTPQCEHSEHNERAEFHAGPAYLLVRASCYCGRSRDFYICRGFWQSIIGGFVSACPECGVKDHSHSVYTPLGWVE